MKSLSEIKDEVSQQEYGIAWCLLDMYQKISLADKVSIAYAEQFKQPETKQTCTTT